MRVKNTRILYRYVRVLPVATVSCTRVSSRRYGRREPVCEAVRSHARADNRRTNGFPPAGAGRSGERMTTIARQRDNK